MPSSDNETVVWLPEMVADLCGVFSLLIDDEPVGDLWPELDILVTRRSRS